MKQEDRIPRFFVTAVKTVLVIVASGIFSGVFSAVYTAYYNKKNQIADWAALGTVWGRMGAVANIPVPLWFVFGLGVLATWAGWKAVSHWRQRRFTETRLKVMDCRRTVIDVLKRKNEDLESQLAEFRSKGPKLHGVWNVSRSFWQLGWNANKPFMHICGWIKLSSSNTDESLILLAAYIGEHRADISEPVSVKPSLVTDEKITLFYDPPLSDNHAEPFITTIILEDHKNRKYELPSITFRPMPVVIPPAPKPPLMPIPSKPAPKIHIAWRPESGWCWKLHQDMRVIFITGEASIRIDNLSDQVNIEEVRCDGAEFVGTFVFQVIKPRFTICPTISLRFRGLHPNGKEAITVKLTFIDWMGDEYPTDEVTFQPFDAPEEYEGIPWDEIATKPARPPQ